MDKTCRYTINRRLDEERKSDGESQLNLMKPDHNE